MPRKKVVKTGWHLAVLIPASVCGSYNATREKRKWFNTALVGFYIAVVAVEVICILKDLREEK